jgi:Cu2+-exporting ATPase
MGSGTDLARVAADAVLLGESLAPLRAGFAHADATRRTIRQNLTWAFVYNVCALPLAMLGWIPPYAAALGMAASSLGVVANALRLSRVGEPT